MGRICIVYKASPETDRWVPGDRWVRPLVRRIVRGRPRPGGLDKVFLNLCLGLDRLGIAYTVNPSFRRLRPDDLVGVLGRGRTCLEGYERSEPLVAGIGLMTHPSEWPTLFDDYPVACYLQHSAWAAEPYRRSFGERCPTWPVGIDTRHWAPRAETRDKPVDFLIYEKLRWEVPERTRTLLEPVKRELERRGLTHRVLHYGAYAPEEFREALGCCKAAIFLSSHESEGIACLEAMASGVPVLAWDPGECLDPARFAWGEVHMPATSVPFFDARCGLTFVDAADFPQKLGAFLEEMGAARLRPREYILENLTVEKCSQGFVDLMRRHLGA